MPPATAIDNLPRLALGLDVDNDVSIVGVFWIKLEGELALSWKQLLGDLANVGRMACNVEISGRRRCVSQAGFDGLKAMGKDSQLLSDFTRLGCCGHSVLQFIQGIIPQKPKPTRQARIAHINGQSSAGLERPLGSVKVQLQHNRLASISAGVR